MFFRHGIAGLRPAVTQMLNNTFPKVTFKPETLCNSGAGPLTTTKTPFKTPLFSLGECDGHFSISYEEERFAPIMCMRFFAVIRSNRQPFDGKTNTIPVRWFHILKEVYFPGFEFEVTPMDYTAEVEAMPDRALLTIGYDALAASFYRNAALLVTAPDWETGNALGSRYTREFFDACEDANYKCLEGRYAVLPAAEGGIWFFNSYVDDFMKLNHSIDTGSIRNDIRGRRSYHLRKDIRFEELAVFSILMTKHGVEHTFTAN